EAGPPSLKRPARRSARVVAAVVPGERGARPHWGIGLAAGERTRRSKRRHAPLHRIALAVGGWRAAGHHVLWRVGRGDRPRRVAPRGPRPGRPPARPLVGRADGLRRGGSGGGARLHLWLGASHHVARRPAG